MGPLSHLPVLLSAKGGHVSFIIRYIWEGGTKNSQLLNMLRNDAVGVHNLNHSYTYHTLSHSYT